MNQQPTARFLRWIKSVLGLLFLGRRSPEEMQTRYNRAVQRRALVKIELAAAEHEGADTTEHVRELERAEAEVERYRRRGRRTHPPRT